MTSKKIEEGVIRCLRESLVLEEEPIESRSKVINDLGADSLDFLDIIFKLEEEFKIKLDQKDFQLFTRLQMSEEESLQNGFLTDQAKIKLQKWLPEIPMDQQIRPRDLRSYVTVETIAALVGERLEVEAQPAPASKPSEESVVTA